MFEVYGNTLIDIATAASFFFIVIAGGLIMRTVLVKRIARLAEGTHTKIDDLFILILRSLGLRFYSILGALIAAQVFLTLPLFIEKVLGYALVLFIGAVVIRTLFQVVDFVIVEYVEVIGVKQKMLSTAIPVLRSLAKVIIVALVLILVLSNIGVDVTALLAGLGIGGLAVVFASQKILSDLFSTFVIFFDKPFLIGETVVVGDVRGVVERIGVKTAHIRALTGELVVVPNEDLVNSRIHNVSNRTVRKAVISIPVSYDVGTKKLPKVLSIIKDVIARHDEATFSYVQLSEFGKYAIMFEAAYTVDGEVSFEDSITFQNTVYTEIVDALSAEKIHLGFPAPHTSS